MNWLRIPELDAGQAYRTVYKGQEVLMVPCTVIGQPRLRVCCLAPKLRGFGRPKVYYRDRKIETMPTWLEVSKRKFHCTSCNGYVSETVPAVDEDHFVTERLREDIELSSVKRTFADTVAVHAVEEKLARLIFRKMADKKLLKYRYDAPRVLGIDENSLLGRPRGVIYDVENGKLLDVLDGYTQSDIRRGLIERMDNWKNVEVWCQDMARHYRGVALDLVPDAVTVIDKFHVLKTANYWFMRIRVAETKNFPETMRKKMPGLIRLFDSHWETMTPRQQDRIAEALSYSKRLSDAWAIKESFYYFYDKPTRAEAEDSFKNWVAFVREKDQMKAWTNLMTMVQRWRGPIFNYFDHRFTSAGVERMNRSIVDINRAANGMEFATLRAKALLRYGRLIPEESFRYALAELGTGWLDDALDPDAYAEDAAGPVLTGAGFDPSTLLADLKAGLF